MRNHVIHFAWFANVALVGAVGILVALFPQRYWERIVRARFGAVIGSYAPARMLLLVGCLKNRRSAAASCRPLVIARH
jgi:hypothetical protein